MSKKIITDDLYTTLPAMLLTLTGLTTMAVDKVNFYLHRRKLEAMAKTVPWNMIIQYEDEFLIHSQYNSENTNSIIEFLNDDEVTGFDGEHN